MTTIDGTAQVVTIVINGAHDTAAVSGTVSGAVIEAGGVNNGTAGTPVATGTLTVAEGSFIAVAAGTASSRRLWHLRHDVGWGVDLHPQQQ